MRTARLKLAALACLALFECRAALAQETTLDAWIANDAGPFYAQRLSTHPRFKGERIKLVALDGDKVAGSTDVLTADIQSRLAAILLDRPGLRLAWDTQGPDPAPASGTDRFDCLADADIDYYLGVQIEPAQGNRHRVSLRVLDIEERAFVSGVSRQWQGRLDSAERRDAARVSTAATAPGTRALPFDEGQGDFLAASLAQDLVCALRARRAGDVRVFAGDVGAGNASLGLVVNYLSAQRDILIASDRDAADLVLVAETHEIDSGLSQLWVRLTPSGDDSAAPPASASVYLRPSATRVAARLPAVDSARPVDRPVVTGPIHVPAAPLLSAPRVVVPRHPGLCRTDNPWRRGAMAAPGGGDVADAGCFAVEVAASRPVHLYAVAAAGDGGLVRLPATGCDRTGSRRSAPLRGSGLLRFTVDAGSARGAHEETHNGARMLILLAAASDADASALSKRVARLPSACAPKRGAGAVDIAGWIDETEGLMARLGDDAGWQAVRVRHGR